MIDKADITPKILKWARESARITEEIAASKVNVTVEKLKEWEEGISQPTIHQAETLAKAYRRPFALFFLPDIPRDFQPLKDFRRKDSKALGTASIFIIREIQQKQSWIRDVYEENNETKLPFVGRFSLKDEPIQVADDISKTLGINPPNYTSASPIKEWIDKSETKGIFISRTSFIHSHLTLDSEEIQGFSIADSYAPFVFINSDDWEAPQLFTLVHELAHIWIAESGISNEIEPGLIRKDTRHPVELFSNEVAASALMPEDLIKNIGPSVFNSSKEIFKISGLLGVSSFALLVRAMNLQIISPDKYRKLKREADVQFSEFLRMQEAKKEKQKSQKGGPNPYLLRLNKNSRLFTQIVIDAFKGGTIEPTLASLLLNTKLNHFQKLEAQLYK